MKLRVEKRQKEIRRQNSYSIRKAHDTSSSSQHRKGISRYWLWRKKDGAGGDETVKKQKDGKGLSLSQSQSQSHSHSSSLSSSLSMDARQFATSEPQHGCCLIS